ncbi:MAG: hypothetical protein N3D11_08470 [Candidatus Sumerlaeia bacterium]|nr:hypothetical protein [Candidatus Sumerlaeia bacterium]
MMNCIRTVAVGVLALLCAVASYAQAPAGYTMQPMPGAMPSAMSPTPGMTPFGASPAIGGVLPGDTTTSPSAAARASASGKPEIGIAEAAGTLTDPTDFIYLSKEYVFNLLVLAWMFNTPGVQFDPSGLPPDVGETQTGTRGTTYAGEEGGGYGTGRTGSGTVGSYRQSFGMGAARRRQLMQANRERTGGSSGGSGRSYSRGSSGSEGLTLLTEPPARTTNRPVSLLERHARPSLPMTAAVRGRGEGGGGRSEGRARGESAARRGGESRAGARASGASGGESRAAPARSSGGTGESSRAGAQMAFLGGSTEGGRRTAAAAQYMAGQTGASRSGVQLTDEELEAERILATVSVSGNDDLAKLLEFAQSLRGWQRVGRFPLLTTEKQRIDRTISGLYAMAFQIMRPGQQTSPYGPTSGQWQLNYGDEEGGEGGYMAPQPYPTAMYGQQTPPIDPQAMGEWFHYYQQCIAWERYVSEEVLLLSEGEPANLYNIDTAVQAQDIYVPFFPMQQGQNAPPTLIHFDLKETPMAENLCLIKPSAMKSALEHVYHSMTDMAHQVAQEDSEKSRQYLVRLSEREDRRERYAEWLKDQAREIEKVAEDFRKRLAGDQFEIDGVRFLVSEKPLSYIPKGAKNIVTERLTPYDLLESDGTLKRPED